MKRCFWDLKFRPSSFHMFPGLTLIECSKLTVSPKLPFYKWPKLADRQRFLTKMGNTQMRKAMIPFDSMPMCYTPPAPRLEIDTLSKDMDMTKKKQMVALIHPSYGAVCLTESSSCWTAGRPANC